MQLSGEVFHSIVATLRGDSSAGSEQRHTPRVGLRSKVTIQLETGPRLGLPLTVPLRDLSRNGIGILYRQRLPVGRTFLLVLPKLASRPLRIRCAVCHCHALGPELFLVGARFIATVDDPLPSPTPAAPPVPSDPDVGDPLPPEVLRIRKAMFD